MNGVWDNLEKKTMNNVPDYCISTAVLITGLEMAWPFFLKAGY